MYNTIIRFFNRNKEQKHFMRSYKKGFIYRQKKTYIRIK